jgi:DNA-binding winged helix-turn-helix (wHTH) protein
VNYLMGYEPATAGGPNCAPNMTASRPSFQSVVPKTYAFRGYTLDLPRVCLLHDGQEVRLRPKSFELLRYLVENRDRLLTKKELIQAVWPDSFVTEDSLVQCVRDIRRAVADGSQLIVKTLPRRGYIFTADVVEKTAIASDPEERRAKRIASLHFVGRTSALEQLAQRWAGALQGTRQVGIVTGEAGVGKTALVDTFIAQLATTENVWVGRGQCVNQNGDGEAYLPLLEALGRLGRGPEGNQLVSVLRQCAPSWLVQMPGLVPQTERETLLRSAGGATRIRMLRELAEALDVLTTVQPLVLVIEDLQWCDASTMAWWAYVARRADHARLLLLGTYRPMDAIPQHTFQVQLDYLSEEEVTTYCSRRLDEEALSAKLPRALHRRTRGHPLFLATFVDEWSRLGLLQDETAARLIETTVPESLRQVLEQQLRDIAPEDRLLLEAASVAGRALKRVWRTSPIIGNASRRRRPRVMAFVMICFVKFYMTGFPRAGCNGGT